jgi:hypothetical protein
LGIHNLGEFGLLRDDSSLEQTIECILHELNQGIGGGESAQLLFKSFEEFLALLNS